MSCGDRCACLGSGVECLSVIDPGRFGFLKDWCESGDEIKRRHVLARSRVGILPPPDDDCPPGDAARPAVATSVAAHLANIAKVKACPSWEATSSCGCGYNRCRAGKGRAADNGVTYNDCFACLNLVIPGNS